MRAILIDDDELCLEIETEILKDVDMIDSVEAFHSVDALLEYVSREKVDVAFLDILMGDTDGIIVASEIKRMQPECKVIFVSSSREFTLEAFQVFASGYILKPLSQIEVERVLMNIF